MYVCKIAHVRMPNHVRCPAWWTYVAGESERIALSYEHALAGLFAPLLCVVMLRFSVFALDRVAVCVACGELACLQLVHRWGVRPFRHHVAVLPYHSE